jgi:hypothetical protein
MSYIHKVIAETSGSYHFLAVMFLQCTQSDEHPPPYFLKNEYFFYTWLLNAIDWTRAGHYIVKAASEVVQDIHLSFLYYIILLAYFPKMKVGLSNHQSVCLCVCCVWLCPPH